MLEKPRIGSIGDALRCSEILNNWIEKTIWMPRLYSKQELLEIIEGAIPMREICIAVIAVIWRRESLPHYASDPLLILVLQNLLLKCTTFCTTK